MSTNVVTFPETLIDELIHLDPTPLSKPLQLLRRSVREFEIVGGPEPGPGSEHTPACEYTRQQPE